MNSSMIVFQDTSTPVFECVSSEDISKGSGRIDVMLLFLKICFGVVCSTMSTKEVILVIVS